MESDIKQMGKAALIITLTSSLIGAATCIYGCITFIQDQELPNLIKAASCSFLFAGLVIFSYLTYLVIKQYRKSKS